ncbi:MAG: hypothetical protein WC989_09850 [Micavibrio sp.]
MRISSKTPSKGTAQKAFTVNSIASLTRELPPAILKRVREIERIAQEALPLTPVEGCKKGKTYFLEDKGVVRCVGKDVMAIAGMGEIKTTSFESVSIRNTARYSLTEDKLRQARVRELMTEEQINSIIDVLERGETIVRPAGNPSARKLFMETLANSSNPYVLAQIATRVFGEEKDVTNMGYTYIDQGNKALDILAAEYAVVMKADHKEARLIMATAAGKPGIDELSGFGTGFSPYDALTVK